MYHDWYAHAFYEELFNYLYHVNWEMMTLGIRCDPCIIENLPSDIS